VSNHQFLLVKSPSFTFWLCIPLGGRRLAAVSSAQRCAAAQRDPDAAPGVATRRPGQSTGDDASQSGGRGDEGRALWQLIDFH